MIGEEEIVKVTLRLGQDPCNGKDWEIQSSWAGGVGGGGGRVLLVAIRPHPSGAEILYCFLNEPCLP